MPFLRLFEEITKVRVKGLIYFALVVNILGTLYGYYYYRLQLTENPPHLWIFITDSPNSTFFFIFALSLILIGKKNNFLSFFASSNLIKYGFWTCFILWFHSGYFFSSMCMLYAGIFIAHTLMVVEAIPLAYTVKRLSFSHFVALGWLLINDYSDYVIGTHPYIPEEGLEVVALVTVFLSIISFSIAALISRLNSL